MVPMADPAVAAGWGSARPIAVGKGGGEGICWALVPRSAAWCLAWRLRAELAMLALRGAQCLAALGCTVQHRGGRFLRFSSGCFPRLPPKVQQRCG